MKFAVPLPRVVLFISLMVPALAAEKADSVQLAPRTAMEKLLPELTSLFWCAIDAGNREAGKGGGPLRHDEWVARFHAELESIDAGKDGKPSLARVRMYEPDNKGTKTVLEFSYNGSRWVPKSAVVYEGTTKVADYFAQNIFQVSIRPQLERGLAIFWNGGDFRWELSRRKALEDRLSKIAAEDTSTSARVRLIKDSWLKRKLVLKNRPVVKGQVLTVTAQTRTAGAGFIIATESGSLAVTSAIPTGPGLPFLATFSPAKGESAVQFINPKDKSHVTLGPKSLEKSGVQTFESNKSDAGAFTLIEPDECFLMADDELVIMTHEGPVDGVLGESELGSDEVILPAEPMSEWLTIKTNGKVSLRGNSGAPVVLKCTGQVIGILIDESGPRQESEPRFAVLNFPLRAASPEPPSPVVEKIFGFNVIDRNADKLTAWAVRNVLPEDLLSYSAGMPSRALLDRPYLPEAPLLPGIGKGPEEFLGCDYLFQNVVFVRKGESIEEVVLKTGEGVPHAGDIEKMVEWLLAALGQPAGVFTSRVARSFSRGGPDRADQACIGCLWRSPAGTVLLELLGIEERKLRGYLILASPEIARDELANNDGAKWSDGTADNVRTLVRHWTKNIVQLPTGN